MLSQKSAPRLVLNELVAIWRIRGVRRALCVLIPLAVVTCVGFWVAVLRAVRTYYSCSEYDSQRYLDYVVSYVLTLQGTQSSILFKNMFKVEGICAELGTVKEKGSYLDYVI